MPERIDARVWSEITPDFKVKRIEVMGKRVVCIPTNSGWDVVKSYAGREDLGADVDTVVVVLRKKAEDVTD